MHEGLLLQRVSRPICETVHRTVKLCRNALRGVVVFPMNDRTQSIVCPPTWRCQSIEDHNDQHHNSCQACGLAKQQGRREQRTHIYIELEAVSLFNLTRGPKLPVFKIQYAAEEHAYHQPQMDLTFSTAP